MITVNKGSIKPRKYQFGGVFSNTPSAIDFTNNNNIYYQNWAVPTINELEPLESEMPKPVGTSASGTAPKLPELDTKGTGLSGEVAEAVSLYEKARDGFYRDYSANPNLDIASNNNFKAMQTITYRYPVLKANFDLFHKQADELRKSPHDRVVIDGNIAVHKRRGGKDAKGQDYIVSQDVDIQGIDWVPINDYTDNTSQYIPIGVSGIIQAANNYRDTEGSFLEGKSKALDMLKFEIDTNTELDTYLNNKLAHVGFNDRSSDEYKKSASNFATTFLEYKKERDKDNYSQIDKVYQYSRDLNSNARNTLASMAMQILDVDGGRSGYYKSRTGNIYRYNATGQLVYEDPNETDPKEAVKKASGSKYIREFTNDYVINSIFKGADFLRNDETRVTDNPINPASGRGAGGAGANKEYAITALVNKMMNAPDKVNIKIERAVRRADGTGSTSNDAIVSGWAVDFLSEVKLNDVFGLPKKSNGESLSASFTIAPFPPDLRIDGIVVPELHQKGKGIMEYIDVINPTGKTFSMGGVKYESSNDLFNQMNQLYNENTKESILKFMQLAKSINMDPEKISNDFALYSPSYIYLTNDQIDLFKEEKAITVDGTTIYPTELKPLNENDMKKRAIMQNSFNLSDKSIDSFINTGDFFIISTKGSNHVNYDDIQKRMIQQGQPNVGHFRPTTVEYQETLKSIKGDTPEKKQMGGVLDFNEKINKSMQNNIMNYFSGNFDKYLG